MPNDRAGALAELDQLLCRFFHFLDESRYDALLDLFAPEATWERQGRVLAGRSQMLAALQARSATQRIRHVITNVLVHDCDAGQAEMSAYMTAYRHDDGQLHDGAPRIRGPFRMSVVRARAVRRDGQWRLASQAIRPEFEFE